MFRLMPLLALLAALFASAARTAADLPEGLKFDDGFTWFECQNFDTVENNVGVGKWVLISNLRILGKVPDRSGWKLVIKKDGKTLAEQTNDGFPVEFVRGQKIGMLVLGWWKAEPKMTVDGPLDVEVYYIDGATDKEYLAKTCKVDVRRAEKSVGAVGSREMGAASYYINRHSEILSSLLYFREREFRSYTQIDGLTYYSDRVVELVFNYSENENFEGPKLGRIKVEVDGQPVEMKVPGNDMPKDEMGLGEQAGKYNVMHSDRNADKYFNSGPAYRERIGFARRSIILPLQWGPKDSPNPQSNVFTNDHPGEWKVTWLIDRKPVRIFRFKIGADGLPVPHPEQAKGLVLGPNTVLVDTEIPGEGGVFDGRLTNEFVKQGGFFGRPWQSDEMKQAAEKVPSKGTPFPVPSDKQPG